MQSFLTGWHVLYVQYQHEKKIDLLLKEMELESFLPTISTVRLWRNRKKKIDKPLFPSYIFVNVRSKKDFYSPLNIRGVYKYLRCGQDYAKVKDQEIRKIKHLLSLDGISELKVIKKPPKVGTKMVISYGALKGLECEVIKAKNTNKILVQIESIRQSLIAQVPIGYLSPMA